MSRPLLIALLLCTLPLRAEEPASVGDRDADDRSIYESIDGVNIGRVFLSPAERARLDAVRREPRERGDRHAAEAAASDASAGTSAGYIRVGSKAPTVFRGGRFVRSGDRPPPEPETPGVIRRHDAGEEPDPAPTVSEQ